MNITKEHCMNAHGYMILIKLSKAGGYQAYRGWDATYVTQSEAVAAKKRALAAGYMAAKVVRA